MRLNKIFKIATTATISCMLLLSTTSCKDEDVKVVDFAISESQFGFLAEGGVADLGISCNQDWTVESNVEWCLVSPANGNGSQICELRVDTSYLYKEREAYLTFHSGFESRQVKISQLGFEKVIKTEEVKFSVPDYNSYGNCYIDIEVLSNIEFEIELPDNGKWLSYKIEDANVSSVPRSRNVRFEYDINVYPEVREALVNIVPVQDKDLSADNASITISQDAAPLIIPSREGDSLAVVLMSRMLKTSDPSLTGKSMLHWSNVKLAEFPVENGPEGETELRVVALNFFLVDTDESIPYQIQFLTKLQNLAVTSNINHYKRTIEWTPEICNLKNLRVLNVSAYGVSSLPEGFENLESLEDLTLYANHFRSIPVDVLSKLPKLKHLNMGYNRRTDISDMSVTELEDYGLKGEIPYELFLMNQLESLSLSYNYLEGSIPDVPVGSMPNLKSLTINGNFLTGEAPEWILKHPYFGCWGPATFIFGQEIGRDSQGNKSGITNDPMKYPDCPL